MAGPEAPQLNIITKDRVLAKFPNHREYIESTSRCADCHYNTAPTPELQKPQQDKFTLYVPFFVHQIHLQSKKMPTNCTSCHPASSKSFMPQKENCEKCHPKQHSETGTKCTNCHALGEENIPHRGLWRTNHGKSAAIGREQCFECHSEGNIKSCTDCHSKASQKPPPHERGNNYRLYLHKLDARKKTIDCYSCHDRTTFCAHCHPQYRRIPRSHFDPSFNRGIHGRQARQDPEYCASCHGKGQICFDCHPGGIRRR